MQINQEIQQYANWVAGKDTEMLSLVEKLCNQNSGTYNVAGVTAVRRLLEQAFADLGGQAQVLPTRPMQAIDDSGTVVETQLGEALLIEKHAHAPLQVLLCIHMDTVYGIDDPFQKCVMVDAQTMNGPGVIDAKGGLVVMLYALKALEASPLAGQIGWRVLINPDEELGSPGSSEIIRQQAAKARWGLLFEPSLPTGELASWRKGSGSFTFVVRGRAAHAGRDFHQGRNAVAALARLMVAVDELNTNPEVTFNVGRVSGGGALNIVPELAVGRINVRVSSEEEQRGVESTLAALVERFNRELDGITIQQHGGFTSPPKVLSADTERLMKRIEKCGEVLGMPIQWKGTGGASDGNKFAAYGLPNIDSLGPSGGDIHSSREFLHVGSLVPKARLAALVLMSLAADPLD